MGTVILVVGERVELREYTKDVKRVTIIYRLPLPEDQSFYIVNTHNEENHMVIKRKELLLLSKMVNELGRIGDYSAHSTRNLPEDISMEDKSL
jgi:hypothetical protein